MTRDEIVTALRCCAGDSCDGCPYDEIFTIEDAKCIGKAMGYAADLIEKLAADRKDLINELCQLCGKYKHAHEGACEGCKWRGM